MLADVFGIPTADVALIITVLLFIITVWLTILTWQNVRATNKLIELQNEPFVYIGARWGRKVIPFSPSMGGFKPPPFDLSFELLVFVQNRGAVPREI